MASQGTKFAVGLFITCGMITAILAVIWFGMSRYLVEGQYYAVYFNESVQGLQKDSPVKYQISNQYTPLSVNILTSVTVTPLLEINSEPKLKLAGSLEIFSISPVQSLFV